MSTPAYDTLRVYTTLGAEYVFPDVGKGALEKLPPSGRLTAQQPCAIVVNVSTAVLSVPLSIVDRITWGEELVWKRPA